MDRRTILAFVLIFLVLVGQAVIQDKFFSHKQASPAAADDSTAVAVASTEAAADSQTRRPEVPAPETATPEPRRHVRDEEPAVTDDFANGPSTVEEALRLKSGGVETTVEVETPLYHLSISTLGGRVTSWRGLEHPSYKGGPVELIPEEIPAFGQDALMFRHGDLDLGSAIYDIEGPTRIQLTAGGGSRSVTLRAVTAGGLEVRKIFTFDAETYGITVDFVLGTTDETLSRRSLDLLGSPEMFRFGWNQGIAPTERVQRMELTSLRTVARVGDEFYKKKRSGLQKSVDKVLGDYRGSVNYAGVQNRYFAIYGIVPPDAGSAVEGAIHLGGDEKTLCQSWALDLPAERGVGAELATSRMDLYIGPQQTELLESYGRKVEDSVDLGFTWIRPLSQLVLFVMMKLHAIIPNYGVIIIIISVVLKLAFYPLTKTQTESMKKMQELQPKLKALQEKYKDNREKLNEATMKLYREEKVNPLAGCMPLLVQMPVFVALYQAFSHTIALRGQPFVLWINDLSQPDALTQLPFAIPFLGSDLNVLPILMGLAMYYQSKVTPTTAAGGQMAAMNTMMPLIMLFFFYNMPSGLVIYWLVNTILQGYQSWKIHKTAPSDGGVKTA